MNQESRKKTIDDFPKHGHEEAFTKKSNQFDDWIITTIVQNKYKS